MKSRLNRAPSKGKKSAAEIEKERFEAPFLRGFAMYTRLAEMMLERPALFTPEEIRRVLGEASRQSHQVTAPDLLEGETYAWALKLWHEVTNAVAALRGKVAPQRGDAIDADAKPVRTFPVTLLGATTQAVA